MPPTTGPRPSRTSPVPLEVLVALVPGGRLERQGSDGAPGRALVSGVTLDSRTVRPGDLYAALPGLRAHGADFAADAEAAGATALLTDPEGALRSGRTSRLPALVTDDPRAALGDVAAAVYGHPADRLLTIGTTGTNGKTTVSYLVDAGLRAGGYRTGLVGTVETRIGDRRVRSVRTTPESPDLHALLGAMVEDGVGAATLEVSSHALALHRVDGLRLDVAGFTNLSQDHLDFHGSMPKYFAAKASLFTPSRARRAVVCVDDTWGQMLARTAGIPVTTVSTGGADAHWRASDLRVRADGTLTFVLHDPDGVPRDAASPIAGSFNVANAALAVALLATAGVDVDVAVAAVATAPGVPGRMESVALPQRVQGGAADAPLVVVDYAHTPDAIAAVLVALRPVTPGRLAVVLGAGGDRDRSKRALMGEAAARHADLVVVTDDNPRSEDPAEVREAVLLGARSVSGAAVLEVADRADAVRAAVEAVWGGGGTVLLAGKGHESGQEVAGTVHPLDDRVIARHALDAVASTSGSGSS